MGDEAFSIHLQSHKNMPLHKVYEKVFKHIYTMLHYIRNNEDDVRY